MYSHRHHHYSSGNSNNNNSNSNINNSNNNNNNTTTSITGNNSGLGITTNSNGCSIKKIDDDDDSAVFIDNHDNVMMKDTHYKSHHQISSIGSIGNGNNNQNNQSNGNNNNNSNNINNNNSNNSSHDFKKIYIVNNQNNQNIQSNDNNMVKIKKYMQSFNLSIYLIYLMIVIGIGCYLFFSGFLLMRFELPIKSRCDTLPLDSPNLFIKHQPPLERYQQQQDGCWMQPTFKKAVVVVIDALRYDFLSKQTPQPPNQQNQHHHGHHQQQQQQYTPEYSPYFHNRLPSVFNLLETNPQNSLLYKFIADSPTVTMQRIKGITTGSLPTFIDVGSNFGGEEIVEDNLIHQLSFHDDDDVYENEDEGDLTDNSNNNGKENVNNGNNGIKSTSGSAAASSSFSPTSGSKRKINNSNSKSYTSSISNHKFHSRHTSLRKKVVFIGDDTWVSLFPDHFYSQYPYPSFNVKDLHTVDNGVIDNLLPTITKQNNAKDWDVTIGHLLGVDHVGHLYGPYHNEMIKKLNQMDEFLISIIKNIDDDTLFILFGDHGMTYDGNHGGSSRDETEAALFMYSKSIPINATNYIGPNFKFNKKSDDIEHNGVRTVNQIDLVSTLSLLLGVPIPYGNLGSIIPEPFLSTPLSQYQNSSTTNQNKAVKMGWQKLIDSQRLNSWQIKRYIDSYSSFSKEFKSSKLKEFDDKMLETERRYKELRFSLEISDFQKVYKSYKKIQEEIVEFCKDIWATFDTMSMNWGIAVLGMTSIVMVLMIIKCIFRSSINHQSNMGTTYYSSIPLFPFNRVLTMSAIGFILSPFIWLIFFYSSSYSTILLGLSSITSLLGLAFEIISSCINLQNNIYNSNNLVIHQHHNLVGNSNSSNLINNSSSGEEIINTPTIVTPILSSSSASSSLQSSPMMTPLTAPSSPIIQSIYQLQQFQLQSNQVQSQQPQLSSSQNPQQQQIVSFKFTFNFVVTILVPLAAIIIHGASLASNSYIESQQNVVYFFLLSSIIVSIFLLALCKKQMWSSIDTLDSVTLLMSIYFTSPTFLSTHINSFFRFQLPQEYSSSLQFVNIESMTILVLNSMSEWLWCFPVFYLLFDQLVNRFLPTTNNQQLVQSATLTKNLISSSFLFITIYWYIQSIGQVTQVSWFFKSIFPILVYIIALGGIVKSSFININHNQNNTNQNNNNYSNQVYQQQQQQHQQFYFGYQIRYLMVKMMEFISYFFIVFILLLGPENVTNLFWMVIQVSLIIKIQSSINNNLNNIYNINNNNIKDVNNYHNNNNNQYSNNNNITIVNQYNHQYSNNNNNNQYHHNQVYQQLPSLVFECLHWILSIAIYGFLTLQHFFSTGHDYSFNKIQFETAYIGFEEHLYWRGAILVVMNTFASPIFFSLLLPIFIIFIKFHQSNQNNQNHNNQNNNNNQKQQQQEQHIESSILINNQNHQLHFATTTTITENLNIQNRWRAGNDMMVGFILYLLFFLYNLIIICLTVYNLRRHLMVWKIFAPKFVFETAQMLTVCLSLVISSLIFNYFKLRV